MNEPTGFLDVPVADNSLVDMWRRVEDEDVLGKIIRMGAPGRELGMLLDEFARKIREYAVLIMEPEEYAEFDRLVKFYQERKGESPDPHAMLELFRISTLRYGDGCIMSHFIDAAEERVWGEIEEKSDEGN